MDNNDVAYEGSCLCGAIRYQAIGPLGRMGHCHCVDCRKAHGAAFATFVDVARNRLVMLQGVDRMRRHRARSGSTRTFCSDCGSLLTWSRIFSYKSRALTNSSLRSDWAPGSFSKRFSLTSVNRSSTACRVWLRLRSAFASAAEVRMLLTIKMTTAETTKAH